MGGIRLGTAAGRWVITATVLGSGMAMLDATVINIALPAIDNYFQASLSGLQWTLDGYLLTLSALILLGGSLADRFGRRRIFIVGTVWFAIASLLCMVAPTIGFLVAARVLQGVGAALLTPVSLAILQTALAPDDRGRGIAIWSGTVGISTAVGPVLGGWLIDVASWQWIFALNLPIALVVVLIAVRHIPAVDEARTVGSLDFVGAVLGVGSLAGLTYGFIRWGEHGWDALVLVTLVAGVIGMAAFVLAELKIADPMLPPRLFANRQFTGTNLVTFGLYAALTTSLFLLVVHLQDALNYTPLQAGLATVPVTVLMLIGSDAAGRVAGRIGPRLPLTIGPILAAVGLAMLAFVDQGSGYLTGVLPGVLVFGVGLTVVVAPLTATVLAAAADEVAGIASGVNNAIARTGGLLGIAVVPLLAGGAAGAAYRMGVLITAVLAGVSGLIGWWSLAGARRAVPTPRPAVREPEAKAGPEDVVLRPTGVVAHQYSCGADAPPLRVAPAGATERGVGYHS